MRSTDPDLCHRIEASAGPTGARLPDTVLQAAIARGELPSDAHPFAYEQIAGSPARPQAHRPPHRPALP